MYKSKKELRECSTTEVINYLHNILKSLPFNTFIALNRYGESDIKIRQGGLSFEKLIKDYQKNGINKV